jgi:hypothetical protein
LPTPPPPACALAQQALYRGVDNRYSNVKMDLYLTPQRDGTIDETGSVYLAARFQYFIKGTFAGSTLTAGLVYSPSAGVQTSLGVAGPLTGVENPVHSEHRFRFNSNTDSD